MAGEGTWDEETMTLLKASVEVFVYVYVTDKTHRVIICTFRYKDVVFLYICTQVHWCCFTTGGCD